MHPASLSKSTTPPAPARRAGRTTESPGHAGVIRSPHLSM